MNNNIIKREKLESQKLVKIKKHLKILNKYLNIFYLIFELTILEKIFL